MTGVLSILATSGGLSVSIAPATIFGVGNGTVTTNQSFVSTITGGFGPFTYAWTCFDPDIFPVTPTSSTCAYRRFDVQPGETYGTVATLTVTDAAGQTATAEGSVNISGL